MCTRCDNPDLTTEDFLDSIRAVIARRRFGVVSVEGSRRVAEFSYTVGLSEHGLPELVVTGLQLDRATRLLEVCADYVLDQSVVLPGELLETGPWLLQAVEVDRPEDHLFVACEFYGEAIRGVQLAWADQSGRWPWEPRFRGRPAGQPLLGARAPWFCPEHAPDRLDVPPHP